MTKRSPIGKKRRFEIFKRDQFTCQYCGAVPPKVVLQIDHIHPVSKGGDNSEDNLITACFDCNMGKKANLLSNCPETLKDKAERVKESELQIAEYSKIMRKKEKRIEKEIWGVFALLTEDTEMKTDWYNSIKRFIERMGLPEVRKSMEIAAPMYPYNTDRSFRYFCGVCWRKIKEGGL